MLRNPVSKRNVISVFLGLLALAAITLGMVSKAAQADEGVPFKGTLTVQVEGISAASACAPGDAICLACLHDTNCSACISNASFYIEAQGIGDTSQGPMFVEVLKCFNPAGGSFGTYAGTLTTTAPNGKDSVTWAYSGQNDSSGDAYGFGPFSGKLTVTGGTGKFDDARGSATFTATSGPSAPGPSATSFVGMAFYSVQGKLELRDND